MKKIKKNEIAGTQAPVVASFCECDGAYSCGELERNGCWLCGKPIKNKYEIINDYKNGKFSKYWNEQNEP